MSEVFQHLALLLYATASSLLLVSVLKRGERTYVLGGRVLQLGFVLHTVSLVLTVAHSFQEGRLPLGGPAGSLNSLGWVFVAIALFVRVRMLAVTAALALLATLCAALAVPLPVRTMPAESGLVRFLFVVHIMVLFVGIASFCLAVLCGLAFLLAHRALKAKRRWGLLEMVPPLEVLDRFAVRSVEVGFAALTVGIVVGIYLAHQVWPGNWISDPKVILSILVWLWYWFLLVVRHRSGWRGARFLAVIVVGFVFLLVTFLGFSFLLRVPEA
jgi:HemX protein